MYNLEAFGKYIKSKRKTLNISRSSLSELSTVNEKTIRRIEAGKVMPKVETLELLSPIFKKDLVVSLSKFRLEDHSLFERTKNRLEFKMDNCDYSDFQKEIEILNSILKSSNNEFSRNLIRQYILFVEATILSTDDLDRSLEKLIESISITIENFTIDKYHAFTYSPMEIRILMNIAYTYTNLGYHNKRFEIMEYCYSIADISDDTYPKICNFFASAYLVLCQYDKSLEIFQEGIDSCRHNRNYAGLPILYYGEGISIYRLGRDDYGDSFSMALSLCSAHGLTHLEKLLREKIKKICGFDI